MKNAFRSEGTRWPLLLLAIYAVFWTFLAIGPTYRSDWFLENILIFASIIGLTLSYRTFRLSNLSYTLIFVFLSLHTIGAHYTYAEVPFGFWMQEFFGFSRNHFDRIVHFSFGLLIAYPIREGFLRVAQTRGVWGYWFPVELTLALSALYEIGEWISVLLVNPEMGAAFLGTQGDEFDAIKDMALAGTGAFIAMLVVLLVHARLRPTLRQELRDSLRVKSTEPLGEVALEKMEKNADARAASKKRRTKQRRTRKAVR